MGVMRFLVPRRERVADDAVERAYFTGLDEIPWQSRTQWTDTGLAIRRAESDSGNFHIPWNVAGHGELMLTTPSLMERDQPYHLPVELARGTLNRLRNQVAAWQQLGLVLHQHVAQQLATANVCFSRAATTQHEPLTAANHAEEALAAALDAIVSLSAAYSEQALTARRRQNAKLGTLLAVNLGSTLLKEHVQREILECFNTAIVPLNWRDIEPVEGKPDWNLSDRQVEWSRAHNLKVCGGPLLAFNKWSIPNWLYLFENDEENLLSFIAEHVKTTVTRYRGKVHLWQCAGRMNTEDMLELSEEQRLRVAVLTLETTRAADPRAPVIVVIDQPWAEFMSRQECDLSPLHFADALVRAELGLSGIGLEINLGTHPKATQPRDLLDFNRQIDRWACLGLPLLVTLTTPSGSEPDPQARVAGRSKGDSFAPDLQRQWLDHLLPVLLAKQPVQGIFWNQLLDSAPHDMPHGGLFDAGDQPKPLVSTLKQMRKQFLA